MKILMPVLHYYPVIGGLETWTQNIAERISDKAEIFIVTGRIKSQSKKENFNQINIFRTSLFCLANLSYSSFLYIVTALPFIFFKSLSFIKKQKINIIHCQGFSSSFLGYLLFKLTGVPYITTVQRLEQSKGFLRRLVYNKAKVCIAASSKIKEYFESINCQNIVIIPNGINLKRFQNLDRERNRKKLGLKDEFTIITVARLEKVKGIKYLIKALALLNDKYKLLIIGNGTERENLKSLVKKLKLKNKVSFLGQVPNKKVPKYLSIADCFVLPSLKEGFGIVVLEAMASEVPVVATRVGGIVDIIEHNRTGFLFEPKNSKQIADSLLKIHSQPETAKYLAENAFAELGKYDWRRIAEKVYDIYKSIV